MRRTHRILVAILIGLLSGGLCFVYQVRFNGQGGDLGWVLRSVPPLLAGENPYLVNARDWPLRYPLITVLALIPLNWLSLNSAAALFFGVSSGALAYGLTRTQPWRLMIFLCFPYWGALQVAQWSPLMCVAYLYAALVPLTILKPSIGLPIALTTRLKPRDIAIVGVGIIISFIILPSWPFDMVAQFASHPDVTPILTLPGLGLLVLAGLRWRRFLHSRESWFVLLLAFVPQTLFYDSLLLGLIPNTPRSLLLFILCTWVAYIGWYVAPWLGSPWIIALVYLPTMANAMQLFPSFDPGTSAPPANN